jgi:hypothetical protein
VRRCNPFECSSAEARLTNAGFLMSDRRRDEPCGDECRCGQSDGLRTSESPTRAWVPIALGYTHRPWREREAAAVRNQPDEYQRGHEGRADQRRRRETPTRQGRDRATASSLDTLRRRLETTAGNRISRWKLA